MSGKPVESSTSYNSRVCSGIYCLLVTAHLLNLLTPELVEGTAGFVASCQTYEGGFSSASQPYFSAPSSGSSTLLSSPRPPLGEAHGGYTFCALAAWVMLQPFVSTLPDDVPKPSINIKTIIRWLSHMQGTEIELGGFKGRTNKLVDGCYSWWVGGSFALLEALGVCTNQESATEPIVTDSNEEAWDEIDGQLHILLFLSFDTLTFLVTDSLLNRKALQEYILYAGQHPAGGLRDKPPKYV